MDNHKYTISDELCGHLGAIRTICSNSDGVLFTGAMDSVVKQWQTDGTKVHYESTKEIFDHEHWVTSMTLLPLNILDESLMGGFATGCMDKHIRVFSADGLLLKVLRGHEGGVISLGWTSCGDLISGSWDGTARIWDISSGLCKEVLRNHENGVCVLGLPSGNIITGSTGRQEGNRVIDFKIRIWRDGNIIKTIQDHKGPVRQFQIYDGIGFVSCSNDGSICIRSEDGAIINKMEHPLSADGKPGFILGIAVLSTGEIVSASEDCSIRIWQPDGQLVQCIEHPASLWCVHALSNGDFVTGCDDKVARVFTSNPNRFSDTAAMALQAAVDEANLVRSKGPSSVDIAKLPLFENQHNMIGKSDGQIQMFNKSNKAFAFQWSSPLRTWIEIGEVTGTGSGGVIDAKAYDIVIPVEVENPQTGSIQKLKIGYNTGDNPYMVAQEFIDKHSLPQINLQQIANHIVQCSGNYQAPVLGSGDANIPHATPLEQNKPQLKMFPYRGYYLFDNIKVSKLMVTLRKFNQDIQNAGLTSHVLIDAELTQLDEVVEILQKTAFYHSSQFSLQQLNALKKALAWPLAYVFPCLDLLRLVLAHPHGASMMVSDDSANTLISKLVEMATNTEPNSPDVVHMLSLRAICNMFHHECSRLAIVKSREVFLGSIPSLLLLDEKAVRISISAILLNFALAIQDFSWIGNDIEIDSILLFIFQMFRIASLEEDAALKLSITLGTLLLNKPNLKSKVPPDVFQLLSTIHCSLEDSPFKNYLADIFHMLC